MAAIGTLTLLSYFVELFIKRSYVLQTWRKKPFENIVEKGGNAGLLHQGKGYRAVPKY